ncbi:NAD-dependent protein deacylase [Boudabousia tangfeifanii]|uniref:protein acetyllysine N-acetyltransferase n=1 Tax=Boudabousia tangfeifanii TaxID=1912795 RepID=A0A1D9MIL5_9ACTO|nr:NAD-dependent protein deacylase [Boudabousia tangfeifanii]AOZ72145.1 NAD-dependent protein deacylase [Boudabousia tangfeifanii]
MDENALLDELAGWISQARRGVFFGGAGVSTDSGIPDFRSAAGLYAQRGEGDSPEYLLSHECLMYEPEKFYHLYKNELVHPEAKPNAAHEAVNTLVDRGHLSCVVTQNIDGLHQAAGTQKVFELHGSTARHYCVGPAAHEATLEQVMQAEGVPYCQQCGEMIRPDVVLYGEALDENMIEGSVTALAAADLVIVGGTSLNVYPAAGFLRYYQGDRLVLINAEPTAWDSRADLVIHGRLGQVLTAALERL